MLNFCKDIFNKNLKRFTSMVDKEGFELKFIFYFDGFVFSLNPSKIESLLF